MHQISMITVGIESGNELSESIDGYPGFGSLQLHQSEMDLREWANKCIWAAEDKEITDLKPNTIMDL